MFNKKRLADWLKQSGKLMHESGITHETSGQITEYQPSFEFS